MTRTSLTKAVRCGALMMAAGAGLERIDARLDQALNRIALYRVLGTWPGAAPTP